MSNTIEPTMRQQGVRPGEDASNATSLTMNAVRYEAVLRSERARTHKPGKAILISMLVCTLVCPLTAASAAVTYELRLPNGDDRYYRLEAPNSLPTRKPDPAYPYYSSDRKLSEQEAIVAAIAWAGGMAEVKLPFNGSSNPGRGHCVSLGTAEAGGFYHASEVRADRARYVNGPEPCYLVHLRGKIGQTEQSFYAAVLSDGRIIQPTLIRDVRHAQNGSKDIPSPGGAADHREPAESGARRLHPQPGFQQFPPYPTQ